MKYALLLYDDPAAWEGMDESHPDWRTLYDEYAAVDAYGGAELDGSAGVKVVRLQDGRPLVTDGPFAETKEVLSGLYLIEASSEEEAVAVAQTIPTVSRMGGAIEVRRVMER